MLASAEPTTAREAIDVVRETNQAWQKLFKEKKHSKFWLGKTPEVAVGGEGRCEL